MREQRMNLAKIKDFCYQEREIEETPMPISTVVLHCSLHGEIIEVVCPNRDYSPNTTSLQVMAYCDVKPTELDKIVGETIEVTEYQNTWYPSNDVCTLGKKLLKSSDWFNRGEIAEQQPAMIHGMSINNDGGGTQSIEINNE